MFKGHRAESLLKNLLKNQLRVNMLSGFVCQGINVAVLVFAYPIYLHYLGPEVFGVWLLLSTVLRFAQLGNLGIHSATIKLVAEEHGREDYASIRQYVSTSIMTLLATGALILTGILIFQEQIIGLFKMEPQYADRALGLLPYIGLLSIYVLVVQTVSATLSGLGRMDLFNYFQSASRMVGLLVSALLLWQGFGLMSLLIGQATSYLLINVLTIIGIRRVAGLRIFSVRAFCAHRLKRILKFGSMVFGSSIIGLLFDPFNKLMISRNLGVGAVPVYDIAFNAGNQIRGLIEMALRPLMPEISRLSSDPSERGKKRLWHINNRGIFFVLLMAGPLYAVILLIAPWLLKTWLGNDFTEDIPPAFRLMLFSTFINLIGIPAYHTLLGLNRARNAVISSLIISGGNFVMVLIIKAITGTVYINWMFAGLILSFTLSTLYLTIRARFAILRRQHDDSQSPLEQ